MSQATPDFDAPHLAQLAESMTPEALDALPFGALRINRDGKVTRFNQTERRLSGFGARPTVGRDFFIEIAPCMNNPDFRGRIVRALAAGTLDIAFSHTGDFDDGDRELEVRAQSASDQGVWMFLRRP